MRKTSAILMIAVAMTVAACAQPAAEDGDPQPGVTLRYGLGVGESYTYASGFAVDMTTEFNGMPEGEIPEGPMSMEMSASLVTSYDVTEGPEPGTYTVTATYEGLDGLDMTLQTGDEEITFGEDDIEGLGNGEIPLPADGVEFVVDDTGQILALDVDGAEIPMSALGAQGMSSMGGQMPFIGPEMAPGDVNVGDSWTSEWTAELFPGQDLSFAATSTLTAVETIDGVELYVIETTTTSEVFELDLGDLLGGLGEDLGADDADIGGFELKMTMEQAPTETTVWFDPARGITVRQTFSGGTNLGMSFSGDGESGDVTMTMVTSGEMELLG